MKKILWRLLPGVSLLLIFPMMVPGGVLADNDAMDYLAAPPGTHLAIFYYDHVSANELYVDGSNVSDDANLQQDVGIFRGVYYTKIAGFTVDPQFLLPFADATLDGDAFGNMEISATGLADLILTATIWFIDDPESKTWLGLTPFVYIPIGDYDDDRALNIGQNRWQFRPEVGFAKGFDKWHIDITASLAFYTDNDDYLGDQTLEQDPEFHIETHLTYKMTDTFNMTFSWFHHRDGETTVEDVDQDDDLDNHRIGVAFSWWLTPQYQFLIKYRRDIEVENGLKQNLVGFRFVHAF